MKRAISAFITIISCIKSVAQIPTNGLDVQHYQFTIQLNDSNNLIKGTAVITTKFTKAVDKVVFDLVQKKKDGKGMTVTTVTKKDQEISFTQDAQHIIINESANTTDQNIYTITYEGIPADGLIIGVNKYNHRTFFSDNWPNRARNWLPCNDHPSDKASVEFIVTAPDHYQIISNGIQTEESNLPGHLKLTHYKEDMLLPTKVMVIGAADFAVNYAGSVDCIPVYSWVYPEDKDTGFLAYAAAKNILPWFEKHIAPYPYKKLANVQSKTVFGGMENASAIFYFENSVTDKGLEGLLVHEITHQWFGDNATEKDWSHLWLSEGFATYMTHLYHEEKYGEDSFNNRLKADREKVIAFSKTRNTPVSDTSASNNLMQLLNANSYQKGGWILHMLRRKVGDSLFWQSIRAYYDIYKGSNANTNDLRKVFEDVSKQDLKDFFQEWIYTSGQPELDIKWSYNKKKKEITLIIEQQQKHFFTFSLDITINKSVLKTIDIKDKTTTISFTCDAEPNLIELDPKVNLLFNAALHKGK
ncbi:M1 family metallopeptidase [Panacibacter ginsenosidivorans]|uniref:Aminopeptidase N n=1 Tax=Panacibacter ginsenosidivorans TaxID=1813871 RepID=A0A5B8VA72_9BACT|nr:M1 family metallopeptidase [Panacibacter ginsenosidivorans]QEC67596.1 M1 family metallopeptidase [Panacibacter ginsenosidivorans]